MTPLHRAAHENTADFARLLIEHGANGANIEAKNDNGFTPLHYAAWNNSLDVVRVLIEHGANTDGVDLSWMK